MYVHVYLQRKDISKNQIFSLILIHLIMHLNSYLEYLKNFFIFRKQLFCHFAICHIATFLPTIAIFDDILSFGAMCFHICNLKSWFSTKCQHFFVKYHQFIGFRQIIIFVIITSSYTKRALNQIYTNIEIMWIFFSLFSCSDP